MNHLRELGLRNVIHCVMELEAIQLTVLMFNDILSVEKRTGSLGLPMEPYFTLLLNH